MSLGMARHQRSAVRHKRQLVGLLALSGLIATTSIGIASAPVAGDHASRTARDIVADKAAGEYLRNSCHVGLSIAVVDAGHTYFYNYGSTSRDKAERPTPQNIYELASVTKTFTASLAARAVVDGRVTLDGDFRSDLPGDYRNLAWNGQPITLRTLLTHYSGMPRDIPDSDAIFADKKSPDFNARLFALNQGFGREQFLSALHDTRLRSAPGDKQAYSNAGYLVIGLGLERVLGRSVDAQMRQYIFQPLGMTSTGFTVKGDDSSRLVNGYDRYGRVTPRPPQNAGAAWGLYASTADMAKYVRWQLRESDPVVRLSHQALTGNASDGEAMAWNLGEDRGQPLIWHGGGSFGMSSQVVLYPKQHEGYVLLANDACEGTEGELKKLA